MEFFFRKLSYSTVLLFLINNLAKFYLSGRQITISQTLYKKNCRRNKSTSAAGNRCFYALQKPLKFEAAELRSLFKTTIRPGCESWEHKPPQNFLTYGKEKLFDEYFDLSANVGTGGLEKMKSFGRC